jgi:hypothetical protein
LDIFLQKSCYTKKTSKEWIVQFILDLFKNWIVKKYPFKCTLSDPYYKFFKNERIGYNYWFFCPSSVWLLSTLDSRWCLSSPLFQNHTDWSTIHLFLSLTRSPSQTTPRSKTHLTHAHTLFLSTTTPDLLLLVRRVEKERTFLRRGGGLDTWSNRCEIKKRVLNRVQLGLFCMKSMPNWVQMESWRGLWPTLWSLLRFFWEPLKVCVFSIDFPIESYNTTLISGI